MKKLALLALTASLAACATADTKPDAASASNKDWKAPVGKDGRAPFASTYERYPGRPTALVGATAGANLAAIALEIHDDRWPREHTPVAAPTLELAGHR